MADKVSGATAGVPLLEDDQKFALMKLRRQMADVLQKHHNDQYLLRWLRARSWDVDAAEKMLRQSLEWRKRWHVDGSLRTWQPPPVLDKYHPSGTCGKDRDGAPVMVIPFGGLDVVGLLNAATSQDLIRITIKILEENLEAARDSGGQVIAIFDMTNFNIRAYAWRPAAELTIALVKMYEANYPEILKVCYIINAPRVFTLAFNVVKNFMHAYTLSKIKIYKNDPTKWKKALKEYIDDDNLPKYLGGNLVDPDGNPLYTTKIKQGGKVPKSLYTKNLGHAANEADAEMLAKTYQTAVIKKGDRMQLEFTVTEDGSYLQWDFFTDNHDIRFGITKIDDKGKKTNVVNSQRLAAHQADESGSITCQAPAKYVVTFDNSYSILTSKKLHYFVNLSAPIKLISIKPDDSIITETMDDVSPLSDKCNALAVN